MTGNYYCSRNDCGYTTGLKNHTEEELDIKLNEDGGCDSEKETKCPKCKKDSLIYI